MRPNSFEISVWHFIEISGSARLDYRACGGSPYAIAFKKNLIAAGHYQTKTYSLQLILCPGVLQYPVLEPWVGNAVGQNHKLVVSALARKQWRQIVRSSEHQREA